ncbi:MAG: HNH endonuclease, partial [Nocardioides marinisabuli]
MTTQELERCDTADAVLAHARSQRAARDAAEVAMYEATCTYAAMHTTFDPTHAAVLPGTDMPVAIAGPGAPRVSEFAIIEYGTALGLSADAAVRYVAHVVETRYRLPRLHTAVVAGRVPVWRARRIAEATLGLPHEAAAWVDHHLAGVAATCSYAVLGRLVEEALCRFDPETAEDRRAIAAENRKLDIHLDTATTGGACIEGTVDITGCLDLADALDLDNAVTREARNLALAGSDQPLDVRRSMALGILARTQTTLDLTG